MRKVVVVVIALALLIPAGAVFADPGNNPNTFKVSVTCEGYDTFEAVVTGSAGHTSIGIGIPRSLYADGELLFEHPGRGYKTVWCEWTEEGDPTQYSGDVQIAPPGGHK